MARQIFGLKVMMLTILMIFVGRTQAAEIQSKNNLTDHSLVTIANNADPEQLTKDFSGSQLRINQSKYNGQEMIVQSTSQSTPLLDRKIYLGLNKFHVYVQNNTLSPITVTAKYVNYIAPRKRGAIIRDQRTWITVNRSIASGENIFIINDAVDRYIYLSAVSADNKIIWAEKYVDMGQFLTRFQYTFDP